jgi:hypothetical protein
VLETSHHKAYETDAPLLLFMSSCHIPIPKEMRVTAEFALNSQLRHALAEGQLDLEHLNSLLEDVRVINVPLDQATLEITLRRNLERAAETFLENPRDLAALGKFRDSVAIAKSLPLPLILWSLQNRFWEVLQKLYPQMKEQGESQWTAEFEELGNLLSVRVQ